MSGDDPAKLRQLDLVALFAHDAKNPIGAALANLAFLDETGALDADGSDACKDAIEAVGRVRQLVDDLVVLSKAHAEKLSAKAGPIGLEPCVAQAASKFAREAAQRGVTIEQSAERVDVKADPVLVARAAELLLESALRWTRAKSKVVLGARALPGGRAAIYVAGESRLTEEPRVRALLERGDSAEPSAIGFALTYATVLARLYSGAVRVVALPSGGAEISLELPR